MPGDTSFSATIVAIKYKIPPNVLIFGIFFALMVHAYLIKKLNFELKNMKPINLFFENRKSSSSS